MVDAYAELSQELRYAQEETQRFAKQANATASRNLELLEKIKNFEQEVIVWKSAYATEKNIVSEIRAELYKLSAGLYKNS